MEIDDIIEILCNGNKEDIEIVLKENDISYSFDPSGEYMIEVGKTMEGVRGQGIVNPNCIKYFGTNYFPGILKNNI